MDEPVSFGRLLRTYRRARDLTQEQLARRGACALTTIKKIEADERRPSKQLADRLAEVLAIPVQERATFLHVARAERAVEQLTVSAQPIDQAPVIGAALEQGAAAPTIAKAPSEAPREERRWATVLFADISGYTSMSEHMDPEDVNALASRYIEHMGEQVRRIGGAVVNVMGDAVLAVFGTPLAHEDDAERAVRAALAMRDNPLPDDPTHTLQLHIGINTGEVLVTLLGPKERRDYTVLGDPVNTASRILHAAPAGVVLVGEETYRATRQVVRYRELSPVVARGKERPVRVWEALAVADVPAGRPPGLAPFAGRDEDLTLLSGIWNKVTHEARPHLALILGEPGIGKSRLTAEFERSLPTDTLVIHGRCLPYGEVLSYGALAMALKEAAGIIAEDDPEAARAKLNRLVATALVPEEVGTSIEIARHLALLSGLNTEADRLPNTVDQRVLHASARHFLESLARRRPLCMIVEDIHWADDALLDLIEFVAARAQQAPLLLIAQARPELLEHRPTWGHRVQGFASLRLEPLDERTRRGLIQTLCAKHGISVNLAERVGQQAGGNPLFIEELVAMIAEQGDTGIDRVPSTIKTLIAARLDLLPLEERSTLQIAAVFGKVFWAGGLRALEVPGNVAEHLDVLEQKDFLRSALFSQISDNQEYAFKHELIRDVAYEMLPRVQRRSLHSRVVDWMQQALGERVEEHLDLLGYHAVEAGEQERALAYLMQAAERAHHAAAHRQEAALLAKAIAIAERLGQHALSAELHARRGKAFASVGMWTDARQSLETALAGLAPERIAQRAPVLVDLANVCFWALDPPTSRRYATEGLAAADEAGREDLAAEALTWLAEAEKVDGRLLPALDLYRRALARAGGVGIPQLVHMPLTLYLLGQHHEAITVGREAAQFVRGIHDTSATVYGLPHFGLALAASGRYDEATRVFEEARRLGQEYEAWPWLARATAMSAGFHLDIFDFTGNEALAEEARELGRSAGFLPTVISAGLDLLLNFARRQEVERAEKLLDEVREVVEKTANWHGWLWKMRLSEARAEIALARGDLEEALRWADDAIEQSRRRVRVKYEVAGRETRGKTLHALGRTHAAIAELRSAVDLTRPVGDPAMFLRVAASLLAIDGDDALAAEAHAAAQRIAAALPDEELRRRFEAAEPVQLLAKLIR